MFEFAAAIGAVATSRPALTILGCALLFLAAALIARKLMQGRTP